MRLSILCLLAVSAGVCLSWSVNGPSLHAAAIEIYYAPEDLPGDKLVAIYERARRYIYVSVYGITYPPAVKALVSAKQRGVDIRVITDREKLNDAKQVAALETLRLAGIPIRVNQHDGLMHLKQVVVDDETSTSGSMNQKTTGHRNKVDRLDVVTDPITSAKARDKFLRMWKDPVRYEAWR